MMDLVRGEANDNANPRVLFAWQFANSGAAHTRAGYFQPLSSLSFRVLRPDGTELVASTVVDVGDDDNVVDRTDEGGKGRIYIPPFIVGLAEPTGIYTLEVTFVVAPDGAPAEPVKTEAHTFRVLDESMEYAEGSIVQLQDLVDACFPVNDPAPCGGFTYTDGLRAIRRATATIEKFTGRTFGARYKVLDMDGGGGPLIQTEEVIVGLTDVSFTFTTFTPADLPIEEGDLRVYNRHIRQNLTEPDDRNDPRVEFLRTPVYRFPRSQLLGEVDMLSSFVGFTDSQQNVKMKGMWGYTEYDGTAFGKIPDLIKEAAMRLAARYIEPLWKQLGGAGKADGVAGPIVMEKTLDQQVKFADVASSGVSGVGGAYTGAFTGDPEVDQILACFMKPPVFGSA